MIDNPIVELRSRIARENIEIAGTKEIDLKKKVFTELAYSQLLEPNSVDTYHEWLVNGGEQKLKDVQIDPADSETVSSLLNGMYIRNSFESYPSKWLSFRFSPHVVTLKENIAGIHPNELATVVYSEPTVVLPELGKDFNEPNGFEDMGVLHNAVCVMAVVGILHSLENRYNLNVLPTETYDEFDTDARSPAVMINRDSEIKRVKPQLMDTFRISSKQFERRRELFKALFPHVMNAFMSSINPNVATTVTERVVYFVR